MAGPVTVALLHHPVCNRLGEEITSTVDHFDVMDGSRLALTYGLRQLAIVNDVPAQRALVLRLLHHGADDRDAVRGEFARTAWAPDLDHVIDEHTRVLGVRPTVVATTAKRCADAVDYPILRRRIEGGEPTIVLLGKAWGLAPRIIAAADLRLAPIEGGTAYNHLSVRSAMAIIVDRLLGRH